MRRNDLLRKFEEIEKIKNIYHSLSGPGFIKKIRRAILLKGKYMRHVFAGLGLYKNDVVATLFFGRRIVIPAKDTDAIKLYFLGSLVAEESNLTKFFIKNLKADDIFYDIGANYGFYTFLANEIVNEGEVHTFEPHPVCSRYLQKNTHSDYRIILNTKAVYDKEVTIPFFGKNIGFSKKNSSRSSLIKNVIEDGGVERLGNVQTVALDEYIKSHKKPTFIKLDIEGGEYRALLGAKELLEKTGPIVSMEVWGGKKGEEFSKKAVDFLYGLNYKSYEIGMDGEIKEKRVDFQELQTIFSNFIFKK